MRVNRFFAAAAALFIAVLSAHADQILGPGRITSGTNKLVLPGGPTLGTYQNGQFTSQPYKIQILGPGSTGDVSGMSAATRPAGDSSTSLATTEFAQKLANATVLGPYLSDTTCAVDQTTRIRNVVSGLAPGALVLWPRQACIVITDTLTNTQQIWQGAGSNNGGTKIAFSSGTGVAFKLMGDGASMRGFELYDSVGSTSAIGIQQSQASENPTRQHLQDIYVHDFTTNLYVESGYLWSWHRVWSRNYSQYGALIKNLHYSDNGDWSVVDYAGVYDAGNTVTNQTAMRVESGGSGKVTNSKFIGGAYGLDWTQVDAQVTTPPGGGTGDFQFANNSVENQTVAGLRLQAGTTYSFGSTTIVGNEFANQPTAISIGNNTFNTTVSGNAITMNNYGVEVLSGARGVSVSSNNFDKPNVACVSLADGSTDVNIGQNGCSNALGKYKVIDQRTTSAGPVVNNDTRPLSLTAGQAATGIFTVALKPLRTATATLSLEGFVQNVGAVSRDVTLRLLHNGTTGVVTVKTDDPVGTPPAMTFDTTTTPGQVIVKVAGVSGNGFLGSLSIRVDGKLNGLIVLQ